MEKVYLKYDDIRPCVECDYGFVPCIIWMGFMYPFQKGDMKFFSIMISLQLSVCVLLIILVPSGVMLRLLLCLVMIFAINFLFAFNYNLLVIENLLKQGYYPMDYHSSEKLIKKGIYFKLQ